MKRKHYIMLLLFLAIAFIYFILDPSKTQLFPKCPLHATTGIYCPGCGSQRALHDFLHLKLLDVIRHNVLFLIGLLIIVYHLIVEGLNLFLKKSIYNYIYHPTTPKVLLIVVILFWVFRNIPYYPFTLLAPEG